MPPTRKTAKPLTVKLVKVRAMPKRNTQDALFPRRARPVWLNGLGYGLLSGAFLALLAVILNPDLPLLYAALIAATAIALGFTRVTRRIVAVLSSALAVVVLVCVLTPVLRPLEDALDVTQPPVKADVIVALGGGMRCGAGQLEGASLARVVRAVELWRAGYASTVTLSDTRGLWPDCPSIASVARGVIGAIAPQPSPTLEVLEAVSNTRDEAERVAALMRERRWTRALVVTSPTHSRRVQATFAAVGVNARIVAATEPRFDSALRLPFDRLMALPALAREVAGLVKYTLFGWF
jgi:uncharacterized SAM-binding protein YcdF (DUF218 family)